MARVAKKTNKFISGHILFVGIISKITTQKIGLREESR
jgi:hypothetical protein